MRVFALLVLAACTPREVPQPAAPRPVVVVAPDAAIAPDAAVAAAPTSRLPEGVAPIAYDLRLELDPSTNEFSGTVDIRVRLAAATTTIWLHAGDLTLTRAESSEGDRVEPLTPLVKRGELLPLGLGRAVGPGEVTLHLAYTGRMGTDQQGLFRQRQDGKWFLFSQAESVFARQIVPCFDEPRFKVPWRVTLIVPGNQVALGNAPVASDKKLPDGRREVRFGEIAALPSYLLAVAVGPFELVNAGTVGRNKIPFRVVAWPSRRNETVFALKTTPKLVDALERYFDQPVPLAKLDLLAVPQLFGAMEHPGLITFEASILLGDGDDDDYRRRFVRVAAHELAHQWTGNLVTPAWWDDLWLSEAFATFLGDKVSADLGGFDDVALRTQIDREDALAADAEAKPRAVRHVLAEGEDIDETFDAIAYEKGRAVLVMFEHHVGADRFRDAMRAFMAAHARGSATTADFVAALAAVSSPQVGQALASLVDHTGTPIVELALRCAGGAPPVVIAHARDHVVVPICVRYPGNRTCGLVGEQTELTLATTECPSWVVGNDGGDGYYQLAATLPAAPLAATSPAERLANGDDLAGAVERGELRVPAALAAISMLASLKDPYAKLAATAVANAVDPLVDDATRPRWESWLAARFADRLATRALLTPAKAVDHVLRDAVLGLVPSPQLDAATLRRARGAVDRALVAGDPDPEQLSLALAIAAPGAGAKLFDRVLSRAKQTKDTELAETLIAGLGAFGPELASRVVEIVLDSSVRTEPALGALIAMLSRATTRRAAWDAVHAKLGALLSRLTVLERKELVDALGALCDRGARVDLATELASHVDKIVDGRSTIDRMLASIDRCVARRTAAGDVGAALPP